MNQVFRALEARVLTGLAAAEGPVAIDELARSLGVDQSPVAATVQALHERGLADVTEEKDDELRVGPKARSWPGGCEFPERRVARALAAAGGSATLGELAAQSGLDQKEVGESLRWLAERGWAAKDGQRLTLLPAWSGADGPGPAADEQLVRRLAEGGPQRRADLAGELPLDAALERLARRAGVVETRERRRRLAAPSAAGRAALARGLDVREEVNELTTDLILSGRWREVDFRAYDVTLPGPRAQVGKSHPFRRILEATRRVFLEMGFEETASPWVESAFWDFDALFQPQDHPARDMQDTFYLARPGNVALPEPELVDRVRRTHEDGGDTGSIGWRTRWSPAMAQRAVLRTHTTASTVRELAKDPQPPRKVFCVGPAGRTPR